MVKKTKYSKKKWQKLARSEIKEKNLLKLNSSTPDGIQIKPLYTINDLTTHAGVRSPAAAPLAAKCRGGADSL